MEPVAVPLGLLAAGLIAVIAGGESMVRGASRLAAAMRISPLVIGLTVVAFGTSSPELAVGLQAAFAGKGDLLLGNVVGSNIVNTLLILGASAMVAPLIISSQLIRWDVPLMVGISAAVLMLSSDGWINRVEGGLLLAGLAAYVCAAIRLGRSETAAVQREFADEYALPQAVTGKAMLGYLALVAAGLVLLTVGSSWLVDGAVAIAHLAGMDEALIGMTIVAVGTSLPEIAASLVAAMKGERDIAVGNVVGSNIFNLLGVLGASAAAAPHGVPVGATVLVVDMPVMMITAVACLPVFFTDMRISRREGFVFFAYYVVFLSYRVLLARDAAIIPQMRNLLTMVLLPITILVLVLSVIRALRNPLRRN